jgi:hypothetical protein
LQALPGHDSRVPNTTPPLQPTCRGRTNETGSGSGRGHNGNPIRKYSGFGDLLVYGARPDEPSYQWSHCSSQEAHDGGPKETASDAGSPRANGTYR